MMATRSSESGFTLIELLVAVTIMLMVLAGTTQIMSDAIEDSTAAKQVLDMNANLRATMDLVQRDLLQVGQGLPVGRRIGIPNGPGAQPLNRPGPATLGECAGVSTFPLMESLPAVTVGPDLGPAVNEVCTDILTILAADNVVDAMPLASMAANGSSARILNRYVANGAVLDINDNPDTRGDNIRAGDILMIERGSESTVVQVTAVSANNTLTFGTAASVDPLRLNQRDTSLAMLGTINQIRAITPTIPATPTVVSGLQQPTTALVTRLRFLTYYVDTDGIPGIPRLMRQVGGEDAEPVAVGVEAFRLTYDIADGEDNPTNVRMTPQDIDGTSGVCDPPCNENQIRKVNVTLAMRASGNRAGSITDVGRNLQNTLHTQVSLRSMAFVDRYR